MSYGLGALDLTNATIMAFCLVLGLVGSACIFGTQSLTWAIPYRWKMTPTQVTNYTSLSWTAMYIGYSILDIITSFAGTGGVNAHMATIADYVSAHPASYETLFSPANFPDYAANAASMSHDQLLAWEYEKMTDFYGSISRTLLGTSWTDLSDSLAHPEYYSQEGVVGVLAANGDSGTWSVQDSFANLQQQYIPQICLIALIPVVPGIIYICIKRTDDEVPFSWKHFRENHTHFSSTKRLFAKWFGKTSKNNVPQMPA